MSVCILSLNVCGMRMCMCKFLLLEIRQNTSLKVAPPPGVFRKQTLLYNGRSKSTATSAGLNVHKRSYLFNSMLLNSNI